MPNHRNYATGPPDMTSHIAGTSCNTEEQYFPTKLERAIMIARKDLWNEGVPITPIRIQNRIHFNMDKWYAVSTIHKCVWRMKKNGIGTGLTPPLDPLRNNGRWK